MTINDRLRELDADRAEWERLAAQDEQRIEAANLRKRAEREDGDGRSHYADHLRKRAAYLDRQ